MTHQTDPANQNPNPLPVHVFFVLDRSGSMASIRSDVIGGFNAFLKEQQEQRGECSMTLVQFDSQDAHEVLVNALPMREVRPLTVESFVPRSGTPLYDAMGHTITDARIRGEQRAASGEVPEEIIFVTFTDGGENASHEHTQERVFALIRKQEAAGWSFAYLGANQDAYAEGGRMGYRQASSQNFVSDSRGVGRAFASTSESLRRRREQILEGDAWDSADFFEGDKAADEDAKARKGKARKLH